MSVERFNTTTWEADRMAFREPISATDSEPLFIPGPPEWVERGLCAEVDTELFFPEKGGSTKPAKRICGLCDVAAECLQYALDNGERFGIWGGKSDRERRLMRKRDAA